MKHPINGSVRLYWIKASLGNKLGRKLELVGKYPYQVNFTPA